MNRPLHVRASPDVVYQKIGDEAVLLNLRTGVYWGLNRTGAVIWEGITKHGDVPRIVTALQREFAGTEEQMASAVHSLLDELSREGLVVLDETKEPA